MCTKNDVYSNVFAAGVLFLPSSFSSPVRALGKEPSTSNYFILSPKVCYLSLWTATKMLCLLFKIIIMGALVDFNEEMLYDTIKRRCVIAFDSKGKRNSRCFLGFCMPLSVDYSPRPQPFIHSLLNLYLAEAGSELWPRVQLHPEGLFLRHSVLGRPLLS